jgi:hypothetical protein
MVGNDTSLKSINSTRKKSKERRLYSQIEDDAIMTGVDKLGTGNWAEIIKMFLTELACRNRDQIRYRWSAINALSSLLLKMPPTFLPSLPPLPSSPHSPEWSPSLLPLPPPPTTNKLTLSAIPTPLVLPSTQSPIPPSLNHPLLPLPMPTLHVPPSSTLLPSPSPLVFEHESLPLSSSSMLLTEESITVIEEIHDNRPPFSLVQPGFIIGGLTSHSERLALIEVILLVMTIYGMP